MGFRGRLSGIKLSRPMLILIGSLAGLLVLALIVAFVVLPAIQRGRDRTPVAQASPTADVAETLPVVDDGRTPTAKTVSTVVAQETAVIQETVPPVEPTERSQQPTPVPTLVVVADRTPSPGATVGGTVAAGGPTDTPLPKGGEQLPDTSTGLPWLIPLGAVLLAAILWWRWRRARQLG